MFFSVVIPIYNVEKYLRQCVDSVLIQDFKDYELILVDDGSPDRCPAICDEYAARDERVVVIHKPNGGLSDARNAGILRARGEYLCFLDSDDYWQGGHVLSLIAEKAQEQPDIIAWQELHLYRDGTLLPGTEKGFSGYEGLSPSETLYQLVADGQLPVTAWMMSIRRSFLLSNELLFKKGIKSEDIEWAIRMFSREPTWRFLNDRLYVYRTNREGSITSSMDYDHLATNCQIIEDSILCAERCGSPAREALLGYVMYQVLISSALTVKIKMEKPQRCCLQRRLKTVCKKYLLDHCLDKKVRLGVTAYRFLGYEGMCWVLRFYLERRETLRRFYSDPSVEAAHRGGYGRSIT